MLTDRSVRVDNDLLRFSVLQDLISLVDLNAAICEENSLTTNSWLHPHQTSTYNPIALHEIKIDSPEEYTTCLELIIDRIYSISYAFLNILHNVTRGNIHKNVLKPQNLTLSLLIATLYENIQQLGNLKENYKQRTRPPQNTAANLVEMSHKETQVSIKITQCPCCVISQKCIKSIADELAKVGDDVCVIKAKEKLKSIIFKCTQEESLDLLARAINKDVQDLIEHSKQLQTKLDDVKNQLNNVESFNRDSLNKVQELENNVKKLDDARESEIQKQIVLHNIIDKLFRDKKALEENVNHNKDQIKQLEDLIEKQVFSMKELQDELRNFKTNNKRLLSQEELLNAENDLWKVRFTRIQGESKQAKEEIQKLRTHMQQIKKIVSSIEENYVSLEQNILETYTIIENNFEDYENLYTRIKDVVKTSAILEDKVNYTAYNVNLTTSAVPSLTNATAEDMEVKGDPLLDMLKQIECNNKNIDKMKHQNEVLSKTVRKFQERRTNCI